MKASAAALLASFILAAAVSAADTAPGMILVPERPVQGQSLVSAHDPTVRMDLPASAIYVGAYRWIITEYADDVELHAFVDADKAKHVQRLYWLQFEAYLPSHPELHHSYDSKRHTTLGGMDFLVDTWVEKVSSGDNPDSDSAHLKALLAAKGYALAPSMMSVRFVHLMDGGRKELMYIYSEPVPDGYTAGELDSGGVDAELWPFIEKALIERAEKSVQFH